MTRFGVDPVQNVLCARLRSVMPKRLALSPSRASDYKQCPLLYRFRAIDKLP